MSIHKFPVAGSAVDQIAYILAESGENPADYDVEAIASATITHDARARLQWIVEDHDDFWSIVMRHAHEED